MDKLKNFIRNIVFDVVEEHSEHHFTSFKLINNETGEKIDEHCSLSIKPSKGDVIICDDSTSEELHFEFNVVSVKYSSGGSYGEIFGNVLPKAKEDFQGTEKGEMRDLLMEVVAAQELKMLDHELRVTVHLVERIKSLVKKIDGDS